jgi:hypothetical protein
MRVHCTKANYEADLGEAAIFFKWNPKIEATLGLEKTAPLYGDVYIHASIWGCERIP